MKNNFILEDINYKIGNKEILKEISIKFSGNGLIGLLGPNGSGKTSLMRIIVGLIKNQKGNIFVDDIEILKNPKTMVENIGYLPQQFEIYPNITGLDFLKYAASKKKIEKNKIKNNIELVINRFGLSEIVKRPFSKYSGGYKRRLGLAQAFLGNPKLLVIDEPTVGLDPDSRFEFRKYLSEIKEETIVLISTHIAEDIEYYSDRIVIMKEGRKIFDDSNEKLLETVDNKVYEIVVSEKEYSELEKSYYIMDKNFIDKDKIEIKLISENKMEDKYRVVKPKLENAYVYIQQKG